MEHRPQPLTYFINLDERGGFFADVRDSNDNTVFELHGYDIFEDGFMRHKDDLDGLKKYLIDLGIMNKHKDLIRGNS
jgi:hypothetical protein